MVGGVGGGEEAGDVADHFFEGGTAGRGTLKGVFALEELHFAECHSRVAFCEFQAEVIDQCLQVHDIALFFVAPPQQRGEVGEGFGEDFHLFEGGDVCVEVSLAELVTVLVDEEADVGELWGRPTEGLVHGDVLGGAGHPFASSDNVRDLHEVVVHYVGEMVCREAVGLKENWVFICGFGDMAASFERPEGAIDAVFVCRVLVWDFETYGVRFALVRSFVTLFLGYRGRGACTVVVSCDAELVSMFRQRIQALGRTETAICMS